MIFRSKKTTQEALPEDTYYERNKHALGLSLHEYNRLKKFESWYISNTHIVFQNRHFRTSSPYWFLQSIEEIFIQEIYQFQTHKAQPLIIDCGASWGLSIIYFKQRFPSATILAYEADSKIYEMASNNLQGYAFDGVTLYNKAIWIADGSLIFSSEGAVGGCVDELKDHFNLPDYTQAPDETWIGNYNLYYGTYKTDDKKVAAVRLKHVLENCTTVDFLKLDIEGAEHKVIIDCADEIYKVERMFVEYHSFPHQRQLLEDILRTISNSGFRYYIKEAANNYPHPFNRNKTMLYDLQLNIFCYR